jgi:hypothetical protein
VVPTANTIGITVGASLTGLAPILIFLLLLCEHYVEDLTLARGQSSRQLRAVLGQGSGPIAHRKRDRAARNIAGRDLYDLSIPYFQ